MVAGHTLAICIATFLFANSIGSVRIRSMLPIVKKFIPHEISCYEAKIPKKYSIVVQSWIRY